MFEGVKARFPFLLPALKEQDVADRVLKANQHGRPVVQMPFVVSTLPAMRPLPVWAFDQLTSLFGLTTRWTRSRDGRRPATPEARSRA